MNHKGMFYYGDDLPPSLPAWFGAYNARQTIEAGIKEEKAVFTLKRHLVHPPTGMQVQHQFALFGANFPLGRRVGAKTSCGRQTVPTDSDAHSTKSRPWCASSLMLEHAGYVMPSVTF